MDILILFGEGRIEFCESRTLVKLFKCCKTVRDEFEPKLSKTIVLRELFFSPDERLSLPISALPYSNIVLKYKLCELEELI